MTSETKIILTPNFIEYSQQLLRAGLEGYAIDPNNYPIAGLQYEAVLHKTDNTPFTDIKRLPGRPKLNKD